MMWRPDRWDRERIIDSVDFDDIGYEEALVEAGADALLEALRATGVYWDEMEEKGRLVFIPDKEANDHP